MKTVWHGGLFHDCRPTFSVKSVCRSRKASCEIRWESSVLGTANKVKARPQKCEKKKKIGTKQKRP